MQRNRLPLTGAAAALIFLGACIQVYPPQGQPTPAQTPQASAAKQEDAKDKDKGPFKPYDEVLKDTKAIDGFLKFHLKRDHTLFLEVRPEQLDMDFGLMMHYSRGLGDFNVHDGLPAIRNTRLMRLQRVGDQLLLVHRNERFRADAGSPMEASLADNVGHSVVAALEIKSEHEETKNLVVDVTDFFVSDYADDARSLRFYYGNKPVGFDKKLSYVDKVSGFPNNVEIDALLTFKASESPRFGGEGVSDVRSIPIGMRFSLFALPDDPMQPRYADDRVGHFLTAVKDFSRDREETSYVRFIERWRLEKRDPTAEISEPVQPIVFYIDRSVPLEYRRYVKEGIEGWNQAYEAAGFKNAIVAKQAPTPEEDPAWSAEDMRYSTVRWTAAHSMGYAIGPSETDPRTGEILNADVLISSTFVRSWLFDWQEIAGPEGMIERFMEAQRLREQLSPQLAARFCMAEIGKAHQLGVGYAMLLGLGVLPAGSPMPEEFLGDAIRDLIFHEVGHTLGLRHNFKGSSGIPHERLHDKSFTDTHGVTLSVMDYGPVNVAVNPKKQGNYWNKRVGTYDIWAIKYAYMPIYLNSGTNGDGPGKATSEQELPVLREIASLAADPYHTYGTDEDNWLGPWAVDPLTNAWELGSDPVKHAKDRAEIVARIMPNLESRLIEKGAGYQRLRGAMSSLVFERYISLSPVTKTVGGLYFTRDHKGDPNQRMPFTPVPAAKQREAVRLLIDQAFDEDAFAFDPKMLNQLAPNRYTHWGVGWGVTPVDFPVHSLVEQVQSILLAQLLNPIRIERMIDNELRTTGDVYTAAELFNDLTAATWSELAGQRVRPVSSFRRNLQRVYTNQLIDLMLSPSPIIPEDARSLARLHLKRISARVESAQGQSGLDDFSAAHLDETGARIKRALDAEVSIEIKS